jgi:hypothetical protein
VRDTGSPLFALAQIKHVSGSPVHQEMIVETPSTSYSLTLERTVVLACPADLVAGPQTLKVSMAAQAGTVSNGATATRPSHLLVEDIGSA